MSIIDCCSFVVCTGGSRFFFYAFILDSRNSQIIINGRLFSIMVELFDFTEAFLVVDTLLFGFDRFYGRALSSDLFHYFRGGGSQIVPELVMIVTLHVFHNSNLSDT